MYTSRANNTFLLNRLRMYSPPKGTLFHCVYECFKYSHFYIWPSEKPGRPLVCKSCNNLTYDVFPERTTKADVIFHGCEECLKLWNTMYYSDQERFIDKQDVINACLISKDEATKHKIINAWNKAHPQRKGQIRRTVLKETEVDKVLVDTED